MCLPQGGGVVAPARAPPPPSSSLSTRGPARPPPPAPGLDPALAPARHTGDPPGKPLPRPLLRLRHLPRGGAASRRGADRPTSRPSRGVAPAAAALAAVHPDPAPARRAGAPSRRRGRCPSSRVARARSSRHLSPARSFPSRRLRSCPPSSHITRARSSRHSSFRMASSARARLRSSTPRPPPHAVRSAACRPRHATSPPAGGNPLHTVQHSPTDTSGGAAAPARCRRGWSRGPTVGLGAGATGWPG